MKSPRHLMKMRTDVERLVAGGENDWGEPTTTRQVIYAALPCWVWSTNSSLLLTDEVLGVKSAWSAVVPKSAVVLERDFLVRIRDRRGAPVFTDGAIYRVVKKADWLSYTTVALEVVHG